MNAFSEVENGMVIGAQAEYERQFTDNGGDRCEKALLDAEGFTDWLSAACIDEQPYQDGYLAGYVRASNDARELAADYLHARGMSVPDLLAQLMNIDGDPKASLAARNELVARFMAEVHEVAA